MYMMKHHYKLPDVRIAQNMREGHTKLGVGSTAFRNLVRKGIVKKIEVSQVNACSYVKKEKTV
jgi:hypothetical protein